MYGSGAAIGMEADIIKTARAIIRKVLHRACTVCIGAVAGTTVRGFVVSRIGATAILRVAAIVLASA